MRPSVQSPLCLTWPLRFFLLLLVASFMNVLSMLALDDQRGTVDRAMKVVKEMKRQQHTEAAECHRRIDDLARALRIKIPKRKRPGR